jgi:NitT/TauT family transport system substrate-binding protein
MEVLMKRPVTCGLILIFSLFLLSPLAAEGVPEDSPSEPLRLSVVGLKGPSSIGMLPLFDTKPFIAEGVDVQYSIVPDPQIMISRIMSGEADIAAVPINLAAVLYNKGVPYRLGAVPGDGILHIVSSRRDIFSMEDLRGKKIYCIAQGSTPEFILRYALDSAGIDPDEDVQIDFSFDHVAIAPQLIAGRVDLAVLPEPFVSIVAAKNPDVRPVIDLQQVWAEASGSGESYPTTGILVRKELYETHPEALSRFFAEYAAAVDWVNAHPAETGALAAAWMEMPAPVIAAALPRLNLRFQLPAEARPRVEELFAVLYGFAPASVGGTIPGDEFYGE